jgi:hypothetical protein
MAAEADQGSTSWVQELWAAYLLNDQDAHTSSVCVDMESWLERTVESIEPAISSYLSEADARAIRRHVPFERDAAPLFQCQKILTATLESTIYFCQLLGLAANEVSCRECHGPCELKPRTGAVGKAGSNSYYTWNCGGGDGHGHTTGRSVWKDSWFGLTRKDTRTILDAVMLHTMKVSRKDICAMLGVDRKTATKWTQDYQQLCEGMLTTVDMLLKGQVEVDGTVLSGLKTQKTSYGRPRGALRYQPKTLIIAQQRDSRRLTINAAAGHEICLMADGLTDTIAPGTPLFTDGGHSKISAWNHLANDLGSTRTTVNHSKNMVDRKSGTHINNVENRNKHLKGWLKAHRGGGSRNENVLHLNLAEYMFKQWFSTGRLKHDIGLFFYALWVQFGFPPGEPRAKDAVGDGRASKFQPPPAQPVGALALPQAACPRTLELWGMLNGELLPAATTWTDNTGFQYARLLWMKHTKHEHLTKIVPFLLGNGVPANLIQEWFSLKQCALSRKEQTTIRDWCSWYKARNPLYYYWDMVRQLWLKFDGTARPQKRKIVPRSR